MYRVILTLDHKDGFIKKTPYDFTTLDKALIFIREADHVNRKNMPDFFHKYELFQLRKDVKTT